MIEKIFRPVSLRLLELLLGNDRSLSELSDLMNISKPTLQQRYIEDLLRIGIIKKTVIKTNVGKEVRYNVLPFTFHISLEPSTHSCLCMTSPKGHLSQPFLLHQIQDPDFQEDLSELISILDSKKQNDRPDSMILFGSVARGEGTRKSDLDILVLKNKWMKNTKDSFIDLLSKVSLKMTHRLSPVFMTNKEFTNGSGPLIKEVKESGIIIFENGGEGALWKEMKKYRSISI